MQDMILLGFLMDGSRTGYQIKKLMESSTNFFFNTSLGSIYPAFKKLQRQGLVELEETVEEGRLNKLYSITAKGKKKFSEWLTAVPGLSKLREEALLKMFFFSNLAPEERKRQVVRYLDVIRERREELIRLRARLMDINVDFFQMSTLEFGISYYDFLLSWHQKFINELDHNDRS